MHFFRLSKLPAFRLLISVLIIMVIQGCTATTDYKGVNSLSTNNQKPKILLMPIDVELSLLTAGGMLEPQAEWTENAREHMASAINHRLGNDNIELVEFTPQSDDPASVYVQLEKLHQTVGYNILIHHLGPVKLPNKNGKFDWTLGEEAQALKQATNADYALFVFVRDSYSSAGRKAMQVLLAIGGVGIAGGQQVGFASLVDLKSGDIVWFNRLASSSGDLRESTPASNTVNHLLDTLPTP